MAHSPPARAEAPPRSSSIIRATTDGLEMVCPWPIGRLVSSYAWLASAASTKAWRGTVSSASATAASVRPPALSRATMRRRTSAESRPRPDGVAWRAAWLAACCKGA